jgi:predicted Ser/Thr protein kinase
MATIVPLFTRDEVVTACRTADILGAGMDGVVFAFKDRFAVKVLYYADPKYPRGEVERFMEFNEEKITPTLFDTWTHNGSVFILMELMDGTLEDITSSLNMTQIENIREQLKYIRSVLFKHEVLIEDLHYGNILYKVIGDIIKISIGDFGHARSSRQTDDARWDQLNQQLTNVGIKEDYVILRNPRSDWPRLRKNVFMTR